MQNILAYSNRGQAVYLYSAKAYSKPYQPPKMKLLAKIVYINHQLFSQKVPSWMFDKVLISLCSVNHKNKQIKIERG